MSPNSFEWPALSTSETDIAPEAEPSIRNLAVIARIMKRALPPEAKISRGAKELMQNCVSEFISFITSEAAEKCQGKSQGKERGLIEGKDILSAMKTLDFENYAKALEPYLSKYLEAKGPVHSETKSGERTCAGSFI